MDERNQNARRLPKLDERETLSDIAHAALAYADTVENELWKAAYMNLASAADHLDAMISRTEFIPNGSDQVDKLAEWILTNIPEEIGKGTSESAVEVAIRLMGEHKGINF